MALLFYLYVILICRLTGNLTVAYVTKITDPDSEPYKPMPPPQINDNEKDTKFWLNTAQTRLQDKLSFEPRKGKAKNVIFFLGDGLSLATITAARIYDGQLKNLSGEENKLFLETFPVTGFSKTYCINKQVADSACSATAYMTGVKANYMTIGVNAKVQVIDCEAEQIESNRVSSITSWAQKAGKATGIVTTTRVTHASPAGSYAHTSYRNFECDADIHRTGVDPTKCTTDIAKQLVYQEPGKFIKVILGGGRAKFLPNTTKDSDGVYGERWDNDNLIEAWKRDKEHVQKQTSAVVFNKEDLLKINPNEVDYLLGLFRSQHLNYHLEADIRKEPTLSQMTEKAIEVLRKEDKGFYLFVEGGKIDLAHHSNLARIALDETVEFVKAIQTASEMTDERDTLIVVTADHSHVMTISGYPDRGTDILKYYGKASDNLTYPTLSYANGPGYRKEEQPAVRHDFTKDDFLQARFPYPAMVPKEMESHGGEDVAVYARGPWSHLFSGTYEQNYIPIAEAFAASIGPYYQPPSSKACSYFSNANVLLLSILTGLFCLTCEIHLLFS